MRSNKGQNMVEYVLLVVAVILVCLYFFFNGAMKQSVNTTLSGIANEVDQINSQIQLPDLPAAVTTTINTSP